MGDREDLVYQAKLAEQAERYDGKVATIVAFDEEHDHRCFFLR